MVFSEIRRFVCGILQTHCKENPSYLFLFWELRGLSPNFQIHVSVSDLYIRRINPHNSLQQSRRRSWKYINLWRIYECRNWETGHYNSVLELTLSFLGIHQWEPCRHLYWIFTSPSFEVHSDTAWYANVSRLYRLWCCWCSNFFNVTQRVNLLRIFGLKVFVLWNSIQIFYS